MTIIVPTVGRKVWYRPNKQDRLGYGGLQDWCHAKESTRENTVLQPCDATIVAVHGDRCVNLVIFDHNGNIHKRTSVTLLQPGDTPHPDSAYCEWMPYQVGQAQSAQLVKPLLTEGNVILTGSTSTEPHA